MFKYLEKFLKAEADAKPVNKEDTLKVATTALFLEMAYADFNLDPEEEKQISAALHSMFDIDTEEINTLIREAKIERASRNDIYGFTNLITSSFDRQERLDIMEKLWMLIYADGHLDKYEDALIRKMTGLLGLEHGDMIQAKLKIKKQYEK